MKSIFTYTFVLFVALSFQLTSCAQQQKSTPKNINTQILDIQTGADRIALYLPKIKNKNIAIVANQTSVLQVLQRVEVAPNVMGSKKITHHLVDYLYNYNTVSVQKVFAPEQGFRGKADAGELIADGKDVKTAIGEGSILYTVLFSKPYVAKSVGLNFDK